MAVSIQNRRVTRYPVIRLAKLALWALQGDCVASAWRPCDNHVCGAVAISASEKKDKEKQKIEHNHNRKVQKSKKANGQLKCRSI
jgi:hypothetical protein